MPIVTWRLASSWARAACGVPVGRYIESPGRSSTSSTRHSSPCDLAGSLAAGVVDLPQLGAVGLEDEHVVAVLVDREALGPGRGEVRVGLARVAELELEAGDQVGERRVVAVQALEDDRRAVGEEGQRLARVDQAAERLAGDGRALPDERRIAEHLAVLGHPDGGSTDAGAGQQRVGVVEGEQPDQVTGVGLVQVHQRRPDLRDEGLGVAAEQVERRSVARSSVPFSAPSRRCRRCRSCRRRCRRCRRRRSRHRPCRRRPRRRCRRRPAVGAVGVAAEAGSVGGTIGSLPEVTMSSSSRGALSSMVMLSSWSRRAEWELL